jgi:hypothetical protein
MYEDAVYRRDLRIGRDGVGITDNFSGGGDVFLTQFRIPADKSIKVDAGVGRIRICDGAKRCLVIDYSPDAIRDVQISKGRDEYGESFDTIGYLRTADIQTLRLTWKRGVATSAYSLRFDGAEFFPGGGPGLEEGRTASVLKAASTQHGGHFRWVATIAGILLVLAAVWTARSLLVKRKRHAAVASSHPTDSANA